MDEKKNFFEMLDGKTAMLLGLIGGIMALCTIGFVVLLYLVLNGRVSVLGSKTASDAYPAAPQPSPSAQPSVQAPSAPAGKVNVDVGHFPAQGKSDAKVTVVEFADFRCPFCERFYKDAEKSIMKDYVATGKVKYYFRSFAFLGPASTAASEAAECANEQGKFWQFHDWMYDHQADESNTDYYSKDNLIKYAASLGISKNKFASCLNSDKYASQVSKDLSEGQSAGVNGTPTTFVNGTPIVGAVPYAQVKAAIDQAFTQ